MGKVNNLPVLSTKLVSPSILNLKERHHGVNTGTFGCSVFA